jgi:hypothetical protein
MYFKDTSTEEEGFIIEKLKPKIYYNFDFQSSIRNL